MGFWDWVFGEVFESEGYSFFQLRIVAFGDCFRILLDRVVGFYAAVLDVPLALGGELAEAG